jgi:hypothetical protein
MQRQAFNTMIPLAALAVVAALFASGCGRGPLRFVDSGRSVNRTEVGEIARSVDLGTVYGAKSSDAAKLRTTALTELRSHGEPAQALADTLTSSFPADYEGVPAYVEAVRVDGRDCWLVVEAKPAAADPSTLSGRRYWLFDRATHDVIESATFD